MLAGAHVGLRVLQSLTVPGPTVGLYMNHHLPQQKLLWWWFRGKVIYGNNNKPLGVRLIPHPCSRITAGSSLVDNTGRTCSSYTVHNRTWELRESVTACARPHKLNPNKTPRAWSPPHLSWGVTCTDRCGETAFLKGLSLLGQPQSSRWPHWRVHGECELDCF